MAGSTDASSDAVNISDFMAGGWITLKITGEDSNLIVHKDLLCHFSPYFRNLLNGQFKEASDDTVTLEYTSLCNTKSIKRYIDWLYRGGNFNFDSQSLTGGEVISCVDLHIFGDRYDTPKLREQSLEVFYNHFNCHKVPGIPVAVISRSYRHLPESASLRELLVDVFASKLATLDRGKKLSALEKECHSLRESLVLLEMPREYLVDVMFRTPFFREAPVPAARLMQLLPPFEAYKADETQITVGQPEK